MILQLIQTGLLNLPVLFISGYINQHRSDYYRLLLAVTTEEGWHQFISFMLLGFQIQANETRNDIDKIYALFQKYRDLIKKEGRKIYSSELVEALFTYPIITPTKLATCLGIHYTTASRHLLQLSEMRILKDAMIGKYHLFSNHQLLKILVK
jgi:Fic family protein